MSASMPVSLSLARSRSFSMSMAMYPGPVLLFIAPDNSHDTTTHADDRYMWSEPVTLINMPCGPYSRTSRKCRRSTYNRLLNSLLGFSFQ